MLVEIGSWKLDVDRPSTESAYAKVTQSGPERCGCKYCRNFIVARDAAYPSVALTKMQELGIDPIREAEVWQNARIRPGVHLYGGILHVVGTFVGGPVERAITENAWTLDYEDVTPHFSWAVTRKVALVQKPFENLSLVQVEFRTELPWLLAEPEPD